MVRNMFKEFRVFMRNNLMIIITGASATGKTILSKTLATKFNIPVLNKDELKELLFDNLGTKDEAWAVNLGITSFELSYFFAEKLCQTGKPFIIEGNFENNYASKIFSDLKQRYNYEIMQVYCHAKAEVLYDRYTQRDNSGERHPGHIINISDFDQFKNRVLNKNFKLDIADSITIEIDTIIFEDVQLQQIYEVINKE
jgi:deoxyadenosine/deoxycytidine kinase